MALRSLVFYMLKLSPSTIRIVAEMTDRIREYDIKGILKKLEIIRNDEEYGNLLRDKDETSSSKEAKIEAILTYLNEDTIVLRVVEELIKTNNLSRSEIEEINLALRGDGYEYNKDEEQMYPTVGHEKEEREMISELDRLLKELNPEYVKMRQGAWDTLSSGGPDSFRQSISSIRELLRQVIDQLAPNEGTRKEKVKKILSSSTGGELCDAIANVVDKLYSLQSAKYHTMSNYESALLALKITEWTMFYILKNYKTSVI